MASAAARQTAPVADMFNLRPWDISLTPLLDTLKHIGYYDNNNNNSHLTVFPQFY